MLASRDRSTSSAGALSRSGKSWTNSLPQEFPFSSKWIFLSYFSTTYRPLLQESIIGGSDRKHIQVVKCAPGGDEKVIIKLFSELHHLSTSSTVCICGLWSSAENPYLKFLVPFLIDRWRWGPLKQQGTALGGDWGKCIHSLWFEASMLTSNFGGN